MKGSPAEQCRGWTHGTFLWPCRLTGLYTVIGANGPFHDIQGNRDALSVRCTCPTVSVGGLKQCGVLGKFLSNFKLEELEACLHSSQTCQKLHFIHQNHIPWMDQGPDCFQWQSNHVNIRHADCVDLKLKDLLFLRTF